MAQTLFIILALALVWYFAAKPLLRHRKREALKKTLLPEALKEIAWQNVPVLARLPASLQKDLQGLINIFLNEKRFTGFKGLEITDEIRVTIAAQACLLLLGRQKSYYKHLVNIYLYPDSFTNTSMHQKEGVVSQKRTVRLGESWTYGPVVLSWEDCLKGGLFPHDGRNVIYHEFAHQLDQVDGHSDGVPSLGKLSRYKEWADVVEREYLALVDAYNNKTPTLLDQYGATNPAEFFAVATEMFFEKPEALKEQHAELYEQLLLFYQLDMAALAPESLSQNS